MHLTQTEVLISRAPNKLILFGEHAVLHGFGCISAAITRYGNCYIQKNGLGRIFATDIHKTELDLNEKFNMKMLNENVRIALEAPLGSGLGTSAVTSLLLSSAIFCDERDFEKIAYEKESPLDDHSDILRRAHLFEKTFHGMASGVDVTTSYFGGLIYFKDGKIQQRIDMTGLSQYKILIWDSGIAKCTAQVNQASQKQSSAQIFEKIGRVVERALDLLEGDFSLLELYALIRQNQTCLEELGVVPAEMLVEIGRLRRRGIEAKVTGAGNGGHLLTVVEKNVELEGWEEVKIDTRGFRFVE